MAHTDNARRSSVTRSIVLTHTFVRHTVSTYTPSTEGSAYPLCLIAKRPYKLPKIDKKGKPHIYHILFFLATKSQGLRNKSYFTIMHLIE